MTDHPTEEGPNRTFHSHPHTHPDWGVEHTHGHWHNRSTMENHAKGTIKHVHHTDRASAEGGMLSSYHFHVKRRSAAQQAVLASLSAPETRRAAEEAAEPPQNNGADHTHDEMVALISPITIGSASAFLVTFEDGSRHLLVEARLT